MRKSILPDRELSLLLSEGCGEAFKILFERNYTTLVRVLGRYSQDPNQIQDWIQEIFAKIWENRDRLKEYEVENFTGYLVVSARNQALRFIEKRKQMDLVFQEHLSHMEIADNNLAESLDRDDLHDAYLVAVTKMPKRVQEAFFLNREKGLTYGKVAEELGTSVKTVEAQISQAMRILRKELTVFLK
ncbi:RNA polymerase sigma-70 factor (ECF subfamily) [Dyadobacter jejuensis]|uniref:RNA polymerase sigma-70 factor (ECF subfamily) n=1 Tax=Dyadobacter jejuensis TaxID=1082580 RepID=A0A316ACW9_9BACT|nr:sigma-70 family RNA polymerase sigma factor [Dyadobacter jejuensis]PWJ55249.1 RNA polymerase sigma-70 factor (ECF subfamily) [Dyadobacter jejuensis]